MNKKTKMKTKKKYTYTYYCDKTLHNKAVRFAKDKYDRPISWLIGMLLTKEIEKEVEKEI